MIRWRPRYKSQVRSETAGIIEIMFGRSANSQQDHNRQADQASLPPASPGLYRWGESSWWRSDLHQQQASWQEWGWGRGWVGVWDCQIQTFQARADRISSDYQCDRGQVLMYQLKGNKIMRVKNEMLCYVMLWFIMNSCVFFLNFISLRSFITKSTYCQNSIEDILWAVW